MVVGAKIGQQGFFRAARRWRALSAVAAMGTISLLCIGLVSYVWAKRLFNRDPTPV